MLSAQIESCRPLDFGVATFSRWLHYTGAGVLRVTSDWKRVHGNGI